MNIKKLIAVTLSAATFALSLTACGAPAKEPVDLNGVYAACQEYLPDMMVLDVTTSIGGNVHKVAAMLLGIGFQPGIVLADGLVLLAVPEGWLPLRHTAGRKPGNAPWAAWRRPRKN